MRYHLTPVRIAIVKHSTKNQDWRGCGEMRTLLHRSLMVSFHSNPKERQCQRMLKLNYHTIALISHASKVMLKIL